MGTRKASHPGTTRRATLAGAAPGSGRQIEERALEVVEAVDDLVEHAWAVGARLLGLPKGDDFLAHRSIAASASSGVGEPKSSKCRVSAMRASLVRTVRRLASVGWAVKTGIISRRERAPASRPPTGPRSRAAGWPRRSSRPWARRARALPGPAPEDADAFLLFRQIDELEVGGERFHHPARFGKGERLDAGEQAGARGGIARAMRLREVAHLLDPIEKTLVPPAR